MRNRPRVSRTAKAKIVLRKHRILRQSLEQSRIVWDKEGRKYQCAFCEVYDALEEELKHGST